MVAGYSLAERGEDPVASILAELGVAPLRVPPGQNAAELVLLEHARRLHAHGGCREFLVSSGDLRRQFSNSDPATKSLVKRLLRWIGKTDQVRTDPKFGSTASIARQSRHT